MCVNLGAFVLPGGSRRHPPPGSGIRGLMVCPPATPTGRQRIKLFGPAGANTSAEGVQPAIRGPGSAREPWATARRTGGNGGLPPAARPPILYCWLTTGTALLGRRGGKPSQGCKIVLDLMLIYLPLVALRCSGPWARPPGAAWRGPRDAASCWLRAAPTWSHYASCGWLYAFDGDAIDRWPSMGRAGW